MATTKSSVDGVNSNNTPEIVGNSYDQKHDINKVERVLSAEDEKVDHVNYDRIDDEVAKYADATVVTHISEEENKRLKRLIDRRVLPIMVVTYFLQSLDKGTMSATSIMGIRDDIPGLDKVQLVSENLCQTTALSAYQQMSSSDGLPPVSTLLFCALNTLPTGLFNVCPSPSTSASIFSHGAQFFVAMRSASASPPLSACEPC